MNLWGERAKAEANEANEANALIRLREAAALAAGSVSSGLSTTDNIVHFLLL